jgi:hypothetical protein
LNMKQDFERFWHIRSVQNPLLRESYCLACFKFVGASKSDLNLRLVEFAHQLSCRPSAGNKTIGPGTR